MQRLSGSTFVCECGHSIVISAEEIAAWRADDASEHWQAVNAMRAVLPRVAHEPCVSKWDGRWAITIVARVLDREESFVRERYEDYVEWRDGR